MLIELSIEGVDITAMALGENWAMHPAILTDEETGDQSLDTSIWWVIHRPSMQPFLNLLQTAPCEARGGTRVLNPARIRAFLEWLGSRMDCSVMNPDLGTLSDEDRAIFNSYWADLNHSVGPLPTIDISEPGLLDVNSR